MSAFRGQCKRLLFGLLGKNPDAVVVSFRTGADAEVSAMVDEVRRLIPERRHFVVGTGLPVEIPGTVAVSLHPGNAWQLYVQLRRHFRRARVGMAPVLFTKGARWGSLRLAAFLFAPTKILAYNGRLERHHLRMRSWIASLLFWRGVPLDRIFLRPSWLFPWKRDRSVTPSSYRMVDGRPPSGRPRIGVLSPYFPYPLSHGGAVRIFHLLREVAREFDLYLFAFGENEQPQDLPPVLEFCTRIVLVPKPRYREPRWSSLLPPEVHEYESPTMRRVIAGQRASERIELLQVEYTQLARYDGEVLVEHDVTFDLYGQVYGRERTWSAWWNFWRWRRFEARAVRRYQRVVAMSDKDAAMLGAPGVRVVGNGVDLERFRPEPETPGQRLLFIGSFRHFPNVVAFRFLVEKVWPLLEGRFPEMTLTVVAGPEPLASWRNYTNSPAPPAVERIRLLEFVVDVRPLYVEANLVVVPTLVSAGTNVKVLEAMAMERAVVSTSSGCAGLGLQHGTSVWVADSAEEFAEGIAVLLGDAGRRLGIAAAARLHAERCFDWRRLGVRQRELIGELLKAEVVVRTGGRDDLEAVARIQAGCGEASQWAPGRYLDYDFRVGTANGRVRGFLVARQIGEGEREILNLAVDPEFRRRGVATRLMEAELAAAPGVRFLEVRESNEAAQALYRKLGFQDTGRRPGYYENPPEAAVVMRFQSC